MAESQPEKTHVHDVACSFGSPTCPAFGEPESATIWHAPQPGPDYWNWRCLRCSEPVSQHASLLRRIVRRLRSSPAATTSADERPGGGA